MLGLVTRTSSLGVRCKLTREGAGEMDPYYDSSRALLYCFMLFVSCWRGTHDYEDSLGISYLFGCFMSLFVVRGYFWYDILTIRVLWSNFYFLYQN